MSSYPKTGCCRTAAGPGQIEQLSAACPRLCRAEAGNVKWVAGVGMAGVWGQDD